MYRFRQKDLKSNTCFQVVAMSHLNPSMANLSVTDTEEGLIARLKNLVPANRPAFALARVG